MAVKKTTPDGTASGSPCVQGMMLRGEARAVPGYAGSVAVNIDDRPLPLGGDLDNATNIEERIGHGLRALRGL